MNKKLFTQIRNEWRTNLWLIAELLIVSVVLWYVVDFFYANIAMKSLPVGFDIDHCYRVEWIEVNPNSPDYIPNRTPEQQKEDKLELLTRLQRRPEVEAASWSSLSAPYASGNSGFYVNFVTPTDTCSTVALRRMVTPDFVRVFGYTGSRGESPEQLAALLRDGKVLAPSSLFGEESGVELKDYVGRELQLPDSSWMATLGAAINDVRYHEYTTWTEAVVVPATSGWMIEYSQELSIRVKPEMEEAIAEKIRRDAPAQLRVGNLMVTGLMPYSEIRRNYLTEYVNTERNYYAGMGFLLLNVFLGLLGTFWFRTQQRVGEIAIRKVNGATSRSICWRLIAEGLLLLTVATIPAAIIDMALGYNEFNSEYLGYLSWVKTPVCIAITYGLMAAMIVLGILIPARRAMHIRPALALKDE